MKEFSIDKYISKEPDGYITINFGAKANNIVGQSDKLAELLSDINGKKVVFCKSFIIKFINRIDIVLVATIYNNWLWYSFKNDVVILELNEGNLRTYKIFKV